MKEGGGFLGPEFSGKEGVTLNIKEHKKVLEKKFAP